MTQYEGLTAEQISTFERDGYLIIPNALNDDTVSLLLTEIHSLLNNFSLDDHPMTKFSTGESAEHVGDDYFLSSGDKIRFFFEEGMLRNLLRVLYQLFILLKMRTTHTIVISRSFNF